MLASYDALAVLIEEATSRNIHVALGYSSWTAWFTESVQITAADKYQRKALVSLMSGKGMSQRAIAGSLGVDQSTVNRDIKSGDANASRGETTGMDGKTYKRPKETQPG
jgi:DNA invertase Pin-like site-specific DNA recombinase